MKMPWLPHMQQVRRTSLLFLAVLQSTLSFTQNAQPDKPQLLDGMQFAFKLSNGFNTTQATHETGNSRLSGALVHQHALNMELFRYLGKSGLFIGINGGFGLNGFVYKTDSDLEYPDSDFDLYYNKLDAFEYLHADLGIGHTFMFNSRWMLRSQLKAGIRVNSPINSTTVYSSENTRLLEYEIVSEDNTHPIFRLESDIGYKLKNNDILELGLFYTYASSLVYTGEYTYFSDNSTGTFRNYGRELGLTLNYVFSGYSRRLAIHSSGLSGSTKSESKANFKEEARLHHPSSWLIGLQTGWYFARFIVPKNTALETSSSPSGHVGIIWQYNSSEKMFWEGDFSFNSYSETTKTKFRTISSSGTGDFVLTMSAGRGYRLIGRNNYNWVNISAGLDVNFLGNEKGMNGTSTSRISKPDGEVLLEVRSESYVKHRFYPGVHLILSKDFILGRNSFLSLAFKHTEGFYSVIQNDVETSGTDIPSGIQRFQSNFLGSANTFSLGFKRRFNN